MFRMGRCSRDRTRSLPDTYQPGGWASLSWRTMGVPRSSGRQDRIEQARVRLPARLDGGRRGQLQASRLIVGNTMKVGASGYRSVDGW